MYMSRGELIWQTYQDESFHLNFPRKLAGFTPHWLPGLKNIDFQDMYHADSIRFYQESDRKDSYENGVYVFFKYIPDKNFTRTIANGYQVNVREAPDTKSRSIGFLSPGQHVTLRETGNLEYLPEYGTFPWYLITYNPPGGGNWKPGYVYGAFVEPIEEDGY
ncbi:MAG: SH3 domain-containing protein [Candidatus Azobacteroides sp.]|nr:SH3 domain-containing protein [Candidatus Azobacteroides sp.]